MSNIDVPVSEGTRVFLNFSVSLEDGSEVDSNFGGDPVDLPLAMVHCCQVLSAESLA